MSCFSWCSLESRILYPLLENSEGFSDGGYQVSLSLHFVVTKVCEIHFCKNKNIYLTLNIYTGLRFLNVSDSTLYGKLSM